MASDDTTDRSTLPVSRRGFLAAGGAGAVGLSFSESLLRRSVRKGAVIQIILTGGASQLETFDPKPHAPREIRGPLHSIATKIPGVRFSECFPRLAERANQLVVLRSLYHNAAPIHETGLQLLQTGDLVRRNHTPVPIASLIAEGNRAHNPRKNALPVSVVLGGSVTGSGTSTRVGEELRTTAGDDSTITDPHIAAAAMLKATPALSFTHAPARVHEAYGRTRWGELFWQAARLIENGVSYVGVQTFSQLDGAMTWDAHACPQTAPASVFDYRDTLGPQLDRALSALLDDLHRSGHWRRTLVACTGEMGRSPRLNPEGGRDHSVSAWSGILAGGALAGGQVVGESDEHGEDVLSDPIHVSQLPVLLLQHLGLAPGTKLTTRDGETLLTPGGAGAFPWAVAHASQTQPAASETPQQS